MSMEGTLAVADAGPDEGGHGAPLAAHGHAETTHCANCHARLAGPYCHDCGQHAHVHRSLLHMGEELLHGILHLDGKALRTLPMLLAYPGQLTRRYIDGQRTRFVSPLALFLFMIFLMFFTASYTGMKGLKADPAEFAAAAGKLEQRVEQSRAAVVRAEAKVAAASAKGHDTGPATAELNKARTDWEEAEEAFAAVRSVTGAGEAAGKGTPQGSSSTLSITTGMPSVDAAFKTAMKNPELTLYKLKNTASKFSFLLVPISLPFLWLMFFWKKGVTMYDHAVFSLYSLSFMSLMFVVIMLLRQAGFTTAAGLLFLIAPPVHMYCQLKGTYLLRRGQALWRTMALLFAAGLVFVVYLLLIILMTVQ